MESHDADVNDDVSESKAIGTNKIGNEEKKMKRRKVNVNNF